MMLFSKKSYVPLVLTRVYNKERGRVSYSSTAVVRVQARSMIFTVCGTTHRLHKF